MIKKRITDGVYDDVIRYAPPLSHPHTPLFSRANVDPPNLIFGRRQAVAPKGVPRAAEELEFEKSEKGLGESLRGMLLLLLPNALCSSF